MCGICGFAGLHDDLLLTRMCDALAHRGPDDVGTFRDPRRLVGLGHRRLSIIDLTTGHQPIFNEDRSVVVVFNGEIYNYPELRQELQQRGHRFTTRSDTEVLAHLYEEEGVDMPDRLNGIFAFVIYDQRKQLLFGARDHFGVKPLHYFYQPPILLFGSEIKALLAYPPTPRAVNLEALHYALNLRYIPGELTYFQEIYRVPAGHRLVYEIPSARLTVTSYRAETYAIQSKMSENDAVEGIRFYLKQAVKRQLISDVPVGAYLSGGLDSSAIVAYAAQAQPGIHTFSMGFGEPTDEVGDAERVAAHFQTEFHATLLHLNPLASLKEVLWHVEEPKINILQGYFLSRFARQYVKVALSGLGGDELFAGYVNNRFLAPGQWLHRLLPKHGLSPRLSATLFRVAQAFGDLRLDELRRGLQMGCAYGHKAKFYGILRNVWDIDQGFYDNVYAPEIRAHMRQFQTLARFERFFADRRVGIVAQSLAAEFQTKMTDDFLLNEDRTSMAHGLEVRVPFLDRDLVRFAFAIPVQLKIKGNVTKAIYKTAMQGVLPDEVIRKKKWGFAINPYYQFQKDLKTVALEVLNERRIKAQGIFQYAYLHKILHHPVSPRLRWHYYYLWQVVGFQYWYDLFIERRTLT